MRKLRYLIPAVCLILLFPAYHIVRDHLDMRAEEQRLLEIYLEREYEWNLLTLKIRSEISAFRGKAGIYIRDLKYGFEFKHNEKELFASASLAKVPIMAAAYKAAREGLVDLDMEIALSRSDILPGSGNLRFMSAGTVFTLEELIDLMVTVSDNTATNMVTSAVGIDYVNDTIKSFGMYDSLLSRRVADYDARARGLENFTTPSDMALIIENIYRGELIDEEISAKSMQLLFRQRSRDRLPGLLPEDIKVAHKTGLERTVCHDAGIVFDPGGHYLICVLTGHSNPNSVPSKNFIARVSRLVYERHSPDEEYAPPRRVSRRVTLSPVEKQRFLKEKGLYGGRIDGIVGPLTKTAIREFQTLSGLTPDGIAGPKTIRAMLEYSASKGRDMFRE